MMNGQRMKNDTATMNRRDTADNTLKENRNKNDELTGERRVKADKTMEMNRLRNDELTADRRDIEDAKNGNLGMVLAVFITQVLTVLAVGIYLF